MTCGRTSSCRSGISCHRRQRGRLSGVAALKQKTSSEGPRTARCSQPSSDGHDGGISRRRGYAIKRGVRCCFGGKNPRSIVGTPVRSTARGAASRGSVSGQVREWGTKINVGSRPGCPTGHQVRRPRDHVHFVWFVRNRVCHPPTPIAQLAAGAAATNSHVDIDTVRIALNRLAPTLDLLVRPRGRPRKKR